MNRKEQLLSKNMWEKNTPTKFINSRPEKPLVPNEKQYLNKLELPLQQTASNYQIIYFAVYLESLEYKNPV